MAQIGVQPGSGPRAWAAAVRAAVNRATASRLPANCSVSRLALFVVLVACIVLVSLNFDAQKVEGLLVWVQENKQQGSIVFLGVYTLGVVLMFPAMVMAMAAGAIFGMLYGSLLVWVGSSVGQTAAFVIGRYLLRELVVQYLTKQFPKWTAIDKALESEGWKLVTLLRLSPIAPWNVLNYALSVTAVPLLPYCLASALAILPYLLLFVYFGSLARNLADIFTGKTGLGTNTTIVMAAVSGVLMVAIVWYTTHLSRKAISTALVSGGDEQVAEMATDPDVAELLRVNSSEMAAAAEAAGTPLSSGRAALQHHSLFSSSHGPVSPRDGFAVELTAVLNGGAGGGRGSGAGTPQHAAEQQQLLPKKHTPGPPVESVQLLERLPPEAGGSSTAAAAGPSRAHLRSSYTGSGGGGPGGSGTAPSSVSPLGLVAAARSRLSSLTAV
ncbi:hypothetical protein ABPG77_002002 [Micractinium sp. CCAP 211/92]